MSTWGADAKGMPPENGQGTWRGWGGELANACFRMSGNEWV